MQAATHGWREGWRRIGRRGSLLASHRRRLGDRQRPRSGSRLAATGAGLRVREFEALVRAAQVARERGRDGCGAVRRRCRGEATSAVTARCRRPVRLSRRRELKGQVEVTQVESSQATHRPPVPIAVCTVARHAHRGLNFTHTRLQFRATPPPLFSFAVQIQFSDLAAVDHTALHNIQATQRDPPQGHTRQKKTRGSSKRY